MGRSTGWDAVTYLAKTSLAIPILYGSIIVPRSRIFFTALAYPSVAVMDVSQLLRLQTIAAYKHKELRASAAGDKFNSKDASDSSASPKLSPAASHSTDHSRRPSELTAARGVTSSSMQAQSLRRGT